MVAAMGGVAQHSRHLLLVFVFCCYRVLFGVLEVAGYFQLGSVCAQEGGGGGIKCGRQAVLYRLVLREITGVIVWGQARELILFVRLSRTAGKMEGRIGEGG